MPYSKQNSNSKQALGAEQRKTKQRANYSHKQIIVHVPRITRKFSRSPKPLRLPPPSLTRSSDSGSARRHIDAPADRCLRGCQTPLQACHFSVPEYRARSSRPRSRSSARSLVLSTRCSSPCIDSSGTAAVVDSSSMTISRCTE